MDIAPRRRFSPGTDESVPRPCIWAAWTDPSVPGFAWPSAMPFPRPFREALLSWNLLPTGSYKLRLPGRGHRGRRLLALVLLRFLRLDGRKKGRRHVRQLRLFVPRQRPDEMRRNDHQQLVRRFLRAAA